MGFNSVFKGLRVKKRPDTAHDTADHYVTNHAQKEAGTSKLATDSIEGELGKYILLMEEKF